MAVLLFSIGATLAPHSGPSFAPAAIASPQGEPNLKPQNPESQGPESRDPQFDAAKIRKLIGEHLDALSKSASSGATSGRLGLETQVYPDAQEFYLCEWLRGALSKGGNAAFLREQVAQDKEVRKRWKRLKKKALFHLKLVHPTSEERVVRPRSAVHFFHHDLTRALNVQIGRSKVKWAVWRQPKGLDVATVQIARHYTVRRGLRVAKTSPLKPNHRRAVLRGESASVWGVFAASTIDRAGMLRWTAANYDQLTGSYTEEHIIDLNTTSNVFERELTMSTERRFPITFPTPASELEEVLDWLASILK